MDYDNQAVFQARKSQAGEYERMLRKIARNIGDLTKTMGADAVINNPEPLQDALSKYADAIEPWANVVSGRMLKSANRINSRQWKSYAQVIGRELAHEIANTDTGAAIRDLQQYQVLLIKSLPIEAAQRVQRIATEALSNGNRYDALRQEILRTSEVTKSRATLIARTESSRCAATLTQVRAQMNGSSGYTWRAHRDKRTRRSHREMNGRFVAWDEPPTLDNLTGHAGCVPNCRCFTMPVFD